MHPNAGVGAVYRSRLWRAIDAMNNSLDYWLSARWREDPRGAQRIITTMKELGRRWQSNFDELAPDVAGQWGGRSVAHTTQRMEQLLDQAGWTVEFKVSPEINVIMNAAVTENVGLIKSIAAQHLQRVEGLVMRNVAERQRHPRAAKRTARTIRSAEETRHADRQGSDLQAEQRHHQDPADPGRYQARPLDALQHYSAGPFPP